MAEKKYHWLKLPASFFQQKEMKKLRKMAGGDTYTIIYLKMQLLSLRNEGMIFFENVEDCVEEELALELDESTEDIQMTMLFLKQHGLIEEVSADEYLLPKAVECIGRESASAERMRRLRGKQNNALPSHSDAHVTDGDADVTQSKSKSKSRDRVEKILLPGAVPAPDRQEPPFIEIPLNDGSLHAVYLSDIEQWTALYPAVDIRGELRKIAGWNMSHSNKRKTKRGINAHINSWLAREQDRGGTQDAPHPLNGTPHPDGGKWHDGKQLLGV